jgi:DNA primase
MTETLSLAELESFDAQAKRHGSERRFLCPVCGSGKPRDDAHRSFSVNTDTGAFICHRCKTIGLLKDNWTKQTFTPRKVRAAAAMSRFFGLEALPTPTPEQKNASESDLSKAQIKLERLQREMKRYQAAFEGSPAQDYLHSRGITAATAKAFGCGYAAAFEHWEDKTGHWHLTGTDRRVVFPITDPEGSVLAIHGRSIDPEFIDTPKKTKGSRKEALFQTANAFDADILFLCEGPADAMALHECGFSAVASVATSIPTWLPNRLAFRKVMVALDADETGDRDAEKHINELRAHGARAVRLRPAGGKDWNDVLLKIGMPELRRFVEEKIAAVYPDYELLIEPEPQADPVIIEDVFDCENESGQRVIDYLFAAAAKYGDDFLLTTPTIYAYETECTLVEGVSKHSKGDLTDAALKMLAEQFVGAHLHANSVSLPWTGKDVPLFYLTLRLNGERLESVTCNEIQSWVIREFWLRQSPEIEVETMNLD